MKYTLQTPAAILLLSISIGLAQAATITYSNFSHEGTDPINYIVTVNDDTSGFFTIDFKVNPTSAYTSKKFTGFYFDVTGSDYNNSNILFSGTPTPSDIAFNATKINGTTNLNLGEFDVVIGWKDGIDLSTGSTFSFQVADRGRSLSDWGSIGMRGQATGLTGGSSFNGSAKEISTSPVPLPAAAWLFGSAILGMAGIGYRRKTRKS